VLIHLGAQVVQQVARRFDAAIGGEQRGFEILEQRLVDPAAAEQRAEVSVEDFARARQSRLEARCPGSRSAPVPP